MGGIYKDLAALSTVQFIVGRSLGSNQVVKVFALPLFF
jgi:hypothetical protein